jgi:SAM-dependent methyltransferase
MKPPQITWDEQGERRTAAWRSETALPPKRIALADDSTRAAVAFHMAAEGTALLYRGDYHNARQLLAAMARKVTPAKRTGDLARDFQLYRQAQGRQAQIAGKVLVPLDPDFAIPLRRAPDLREALSQAWEPLDEPQVVPLREVLGAVGAHEWRLNGVEVAALGGRVHPHYGVFAPIRGEYVDLVASAPIGNVNSAFDIGTGTGVLALVLAKRGVPRVVATELDARALVCARENVARFGYSDRIEVLEADLWPEGRADLVVCNPPWLPGRPTSRLERAIYDPENAFLTRFISGLAAHLTPNAEGWLVISDLAERLGLRAPEMLSGLFASAGLTVREVLRTTARHPRAHDAEDVLHLARSNEQTALYRLAPR